MKSEVSNRTKEIIARGREKGRVLNISEAFINYPVEKEVHEGKLEYWTQEKKPDGD